MVKSVEFIKCDRFCVTDAINIDRFINVVVYRTVVIGYE